MNQKHHNFFVIDGYEYDISQFKKRHPGGNVISFYEGMDASDVFHALHFRSEKANKMLASLPRKPITSSSPNDGRNTLVRDFRQLREDLVKEGAFEPMPFEQFLRTLELVVLYAFAMYFGINKYILLAGIMRGLWVARLGLLMHETGHRAFTTNISADKLWNWLIFTVWYGGSAAFWNNQHNKHHAATQELGYDVDLKTLPVVAFNVFIAKEGNPTWMKLQWLTFIPAQIGLPFLWKYTHTRYMIRSKNYFELFGLIMHEVIEYSILGLQIGLFNYLVVTAISWALGGMYVACTFALNHTHRPVAENHSSRNWVIRAAEHTTNMYGSYFTNWLTGYLNYQIEHHLFPQMPHPRLPYIQPRVKALFDKHNVPYDLRSMSDAFFATMQNLYEVGHWKTQKKYQYLLKND